MKALLFLLLFVTADFAGAEVSYQLFPVRGVFYPPDQPSLIDSDFRTALGPEEQGYFAKKFRERFPSAAQTISQENYRRTYAVSLQISEPAATR